MSVGERILQSITNPPRYIEIPKTRIVVEEVQKPLVSIRTPFGNLDLGSRTHYLIYSVKVDKA